MTLTGRLYIAGVLTLFLGCLGFPSPIGVWKAAAFGTLAISYAALFPTNEPKKSKGRFPGP
jgi:hypothetical protein